MTNAATVPQHIAEAVVSPRAHAERDALFSGLRWLGPTIRSGSSKLTDTIRSGC
jgi:hypothetical protein